MIKNLPANAGDAGEVDLVPGSGRSPGEGIGNPLQCSSLENPMGGGAWWDTVHGVAKRWTTERLGTQSQLALFSNYDWAVNSLVN